MATLSDCDDITPFDGTVARYCSDVMAALLLCRSAGVEPVPGQRSSILHNFILQGQSGER